MDPAVGSGLRCAAAEEALLQPFKGAEEALLQLDVALRVLEHERDGHEAEAFEEQVGDRGTQLIPIIELGLGLSEGGEVGDELTCGHRKEALAEAVRGEEPVEVTQAVVDILRLRADRLENEVTHVETEA